MKAFFAILFCFLFFSEIIFSQNINNRVFPDSTNLQRSLKDKISGRNAREFLNEKESYLTKAKRINKRSLLNQHRELINEEVLNNPESKTISKKTLLANGYLLAEYIRQKWDGSVWVNEFKYSYKYDAHHNQVEYLIHKWNELVWENYSKNSYIYDVNNSLIEELYQYWDGTAWVYGHHYKYSYTYDINNNLIEELWQSLNDSIWVNLRKYIYSYDANNNQIEWIYQGWNGTVWLNRTKYTYEFDVNDNLIEETHFEWLDDSYWSGTFKYISKYNINNILTEKLTQHYGNYCPVPYLCWADQYNYFYFYDGNNNLIEVLMKVMHSSGWVNDFEYFYNYDIDNNLIGITTLGWNFYYSEWRNIYLHSYKYTQKDLKIYNPKENDKWIAGITDPTKLDTIKWDNTDWPLINIYCILGYGTNKQRNYLIASNSTAKTNYVWHIPDDLFSYRTKIMIENADNPSEIIYSDIFRLKSYHLTRIGADSIYYPYKKDLDQWGFYNNAGDMWPSSWWIRFNYKDVDPFTGRFYSDSLFLKSNPYDFPDWISWVNTFGVNACYLNVSAGIYSPTAVLKWASKKRQWNGSCFGIATANALVFNDRISLFDRYPYFPSFINPIAVNAGDSVRKIINELFTHQYGNPHLNLRINVLSVKTPTQTVHELKEMLKEDDISYIRALSFWNNSGGGGHTIVPYKIKQDDNHPEIYYIFIYDNSNPNSNNPIIVNTTGNGSWNALDWPGWGGSKWLALEDPALSYLSNPALPKSTKFTSPFVLSDDFIEIIPSGANEIKISDNLGNTSGYIDSQVVLDIPEAVPIMIQNGTAMPPLGYWLPLNSYSISTQNFLSDTIGIYLSTGNRSIHYRTDNALAENSDKIYFDGGLAFSNPGSLVKTFDLENIINETTQEKVFYIRNMSLIQNDSIKIQNPDDDQLIIKNFGSEKKYEVELNYAAEKGLGRFLNNSVNLNANSTQQLVPNWEDFEQLQLSIYVDKGNDGTIDDTLHLENQVSGINGNHGSLLPKAYRLGQNYPNPFNPTTTINYSIPNVADANFASTTNVQLKVYDILGREIAVLVNERQKAGYYEVRWNASSQPSGVYFYQLRAGNFVSTKKLIILK